MSLSGLMAAFATRGVESDFIAVQVVVKTRFKHHRFMPRAHRKYLVPYSIALLLLVACAVVLNIQASFNPAEQTQELIPSELIKCFDFFHSA
jgi:hypothetical protein